MVIQIDQSVLLGALNARINIRLSSQLPAPPSRAQQTPTSTPWRGTPPDAATQTRKVLAGRPFLARDDIASALAADSDVPKIFAAYEGLTRLRSLAASVADGAIAKGLTKRAEKLFASGLGEVRSFLARADFEKVTILPADKLDKAETAIAISRNSYRYVTRAVHTGSPDDAVPAFATISGFTITLTSADGVPRQTDVDLSSLAASARSIRAVAEHINTALEAAGAVTRFETTKTGPPDELGFATGTDWAFAIEGTQSETVSFSTTTASPKVFLAGASGPRGEQAGQFSGWTGLAADAVHTFTEQVEHPPTSPPGDVRILETAVSGDGAVYTLSHLATPDDGPHSGSDLFLTRYDTTGKRLWSRSLGADGPVEGLALAVSDDGRVAIGGAVQDALTSAAIGGGRDGFVSIYDAAGKEILTRQRGARGDDAVTALTFGANGVLHIGGTTSGALDQSVLQGERDAFVETLDTDGKRLAIRHFGTSGHDGVDALAVDANGGVIAASQEDSDIVLRRFAGPQEETPDPDLDWTHRLGAGRAESIFVDADAIYVSGQTSQSTRLDGQFAGPALALTDAFAVRIDLTRTLLPVIPDDVPEPEVAEETETVSDPVDAADSVSDEASDPLDAADSASDEASDPLDAADSVAEETSDPVETPELVPTGPVIPAEAWFRRFGGTGTQTAPSIASVAGRVYLAGSGGTAFGSVAASGQSNSFLLALDAADGQDIWSRSLSGRKETSHVSGLAVDLHGDSDLDRLGLPRGPLLLGGTDRVTDRTKARPGDHFHVSVDGGRKKKITIERGDTYRDLTFKVNAALLLDASTKVIQSKGAQKLTITPAKQVQIHLSKGAEGFDALSALGLPEGDIYGAIAGQAGDTTSDSPEIIALGLSPEAALTDKESAAASVKEIDKALRELRSAHRVATDDPTWAKRNDPIAPIGRPPAYLQAQLANYQAGLSRLQPISSGLGSFVA